METLLTKMLEKEVLNPEQMQAVNHLEGPLLVIAGAGSGKTRVVTQRIVKLLEKGVMPHQILGLTFTNKAAGEMVERVRQATNSQVLISTFHSLGARILRESYNPGFTIYDEEDSEKLLKGCLDSIPLSDRKGAIKRFRHLISQSKNGMQGPIDLDSNEFETGDLKHFPDIYAMYQARLKECNAVDFDDLLFLPVKLFTEKSEILDVYRSRWKYLLIDEYQDTNQAQYEFVKLLAGKNQNLFVVGDPDQSIYSWRGATIRNILDFEIDFPGAKVIRLEQNYRSRSNILEAANVLISHNDNRYKKNLWSDRGEGDIIQLREFHTERDEADFVVKTTMSHQNQGVPLDEVVVFYRTNFQSRILEDYFLHYQIPYVIYGGISFYQRKEVKDILAFLRMIQTGSDFVAFSRTLNIPKRGFGAATLEKLQVASIEAGLPILDFCESILEGTHKIRVNKKQKEGLADYIRIIRHLRAFQGTLRDLVMETIEWSGYLTYLKSDPETADDRRSNVQELVSKAAEWEIRSQDGGLAEFLGELTLKSTLDQGGDSGHKVHLMTLHNGKGLEFDVVFVVGLEEDLLPHVNSKETIDELEEERRLFYVGMTRAKETLYLTRSKYRYMWGMLRYMEPSCFLDELPQGLLDTDREDDDMWLE